MRARVGDTDIEYELAGPEDGVPIVLVAGVFQQLSFWPPHFVARLASAGLRVILHDNRDMGLSTRESRPPPDLKALSRGDLSGVNYTLSDMAADTAGLVETLGFESAHVLGHSMGGVIAQRMAIEFPDRVRSLTLFASLPNDGASGHSSPRFMENVMRPPPSDPRERREAALEGYRICIEPEPIDEAEFAAFVQRQTGRAPNPHMQCVPAIIASVIAGNASSPTHVEQLQSITFPTLVVHGAGDLAVALDGGEWLAKLIPNAQLLVIEGMGHFPLAQEHWATIADAVIEHVIKA
jgi:pimeloyl-ACP methyl ester carboxylesterase